MTFTELADTWSDEQRDAWEEAACNGDDPIVNLSDVPPMLASFDVCARCLKPMSGQAVFREESWCQCN